MGGGFILGNHFSKSYNLANKLKKRKIPVLPKALIWLNRILFSCDIQLNKNIDESVIFSHNGLGVVTHEKAVIGKNTQILQHVTIGGNMGKEKVIDGKATRAPIVGDNVIIGAGAQILGPIKIGDNAKIGAGAVVTIDVPENGVAVGVPARIIEPKEKDKTTTQ